jgi:hypothetical protein
MTAYNTCSNKGLSFKEILLTLIGDVDTLTVDRAFAGIRITSKTIALIDPIPTPTCAGKDEWFNLLQRALGIGTDGQMTLNVVMEDSLDGAGLNPMPCGSGLTVEERLARLFVNTIDGEVAVYVSRLTT